MDKLSVYAGQSENEDESEVSSSSPENSSCHEEQPVEGQNQEAVPEKMAETMISAPIEHV